MDTLMWEARAADGRGADLLRWVLDEGVHAIVHPDLRTEVFISGDRVVVIATGGLAPFGDACEPSIGPFGDACEPSIGPFGDACEPSIGTATPRRLPDPPPDLIARPPHAWPFTRVNVVN